MAETIINSNQLRASGDTSSQTLIGANQVRQSGDSSSQTLLNKNQIASGGGTTLNATVVGSPTITEDFIVSGFNNSNYLTFPLNDYNPSSASDSWEITTKIKVGNLSISEQKIFDCATDQKNLRFGYCTDGASYGYGYLVANAFGWVDSDRYHFRGNDVYTVADVWQFLKIGYSATDGKYYAKYSSDNENWTTFISYIDTNNRSANFTEVERIGYFNSSSNSSLSIDMKETFMTKNNQIVWQGVI